MILKACCDFLIIWFSPCISWSHSEVTDYIPFPQNYICQGGGEKKKNKGTDLKIYIDPLM